MVEGSYNTIQKWLKDEKYNFCISVFSRESLTEKQRFNCGNRSCYLIDYRGVKQVRTFVSVLFATSILADICSEHLSNC